MSSSKAFMVSRQKAELVRPAKPTPMEFKLLSDIDDQDGFRFQMPVILFYRRNTNITYYGRRSGDDPVKVIREAIAKALVWYYPLAGRMREGPGRKLMVECTGEGVMFIEADADATAEEFGEPPHAPFPCLKELLFDVPHSSGILHCPLLLMQVTRLRCGSFIFALRMNHTMCDAIGMAQFLAAIGEIARGASVPSVPPVWQRELLNARDPPRMTHTHHEFDQLLAYTNNRYTMDDLVHRSFFFSLAEVSALQNSIPFECSKLDALTAYLWRCRTIALQFDPEEEVRLICIVNARSKFNPPLPKGYYGNAVVHPVALITAGELCEKPLGYAVELMRKARNDVTEDYVKSVADLMVMRGRPRVNMVRTYCVSDATRVGFSEVDFGWGKPVYAGPVKGGFMTSFYIPFKNKKGENGILVLIGLPDFAMDRFARELKNMILLTNIPFRSAL